MDGNSDWDNCSIATLASECSVLSTNTYGVLAPSDFDSDSESTSDDHEWDGCSLGTETCSIAASEGEDGWTDLHTAVAWSLVSSKKPRVFIGLVKIDEDRGFDDDQISDDSYDDYQIYAASKHLGTTWGRAKKSYSHRMVEKRHESVAKRCAQRHGQPFTPSLRTSRARPDRRRKRID
eukprot:CAMPEP_0114539188 /NCGR_PEP_ID=MMETSP0114-20121206/105_1 /TAXON_ID=31324 /ORGANISM="Goniomonas sp, Strain m" /LENGTH=177 /DNA_ID=CAMNT_0001723275 /DNA_START=44 /DNA_END=577 /DNA_ORIENTATION=+